MAEVIERAARIAEELICRIPPDLPFHTSLLKVSEAINTDKLQADATGMNLFLCNRDDAALIQADKHFGAGVLLLAAALGLQQAQIEQGVQDGK